MKTNLSKFKYIFDKCRKKMRILKMIRKGKIIRGKKDLGGLRRLFNGDLFVRSRDVINVMDLMGLYSSTLN